MSRKKNLSPLDYLLATDTGLKVLDRNFVSVEARDPDAETQTSVEIRKHSKVVSDEARLIDVVGSVEVRDRYDSIIMLGPNEFGRGMLLDNYKLNPVILWNHGRATSGMGGGGGTVPTNMPIGRAVSVTRRLQAVPRELEFRVQFSDVNPLGDLTYRMVKTDMIRASSIGFKPIKVERLEESEDIQKWGARIIYGEGDLLELSWVGIAGNQLALKRAMRSALAEGEFSSEDVELLQSVLGASEFKDYEIAYRDLHHIGTVARYVPRPCAFKEETTFGIEDDISTLEEIEADWKEGRSAASSNSDQKELATLLRKISVPEDGALAPTSFKDPEVEMAVNRLLDLSKLFPTGE